MFRDANPAETQLIDLPNDSQTIELRSPDGSADIHLLLAGITVAARLGLTEPGMAKYARQRKVDGDASQTPGLEQLPASCFEAAGRLLAQRKDYEARGVFPCGLIDSWVSHLVDLGDEHLRDDLAESRVSVEELVTRYFHVG